MKRGESQNYTVPSRPLPADSGRNRRGCSKKASVFREEEQKYVIKSFKEKGMKGVEMTDKLHQNHGVDSLQRPEV
jgi:hypothetical protein